MLKRRIIQDIGEVNTLSQIFNLPFEFSDCTRNYTEKEVTFIENSPTEILEATKEYYNDYLSGFSREPNDVLIDNKAIYKSCANRILENFLLYKNTPPNHENEINRHIYRELSSSGFFYCNSSFKGAKPSETMRTVD